MTAFNTPVQRGRGGQDCEIISVTEGTSKVVVPIALSATSLKTFQKTIKRNCKQNRTQNSTLTNPISNWTVSYTHLTLPTICSV